MPWRAGLVALITTPFGVRTLCAIDVVNGCVFVQWTMFKKLNKFNFILKI